MATKKSVSKKPTQEVEAAEVDGERVYTLADTIRRLGESSQEEVRLQLEGMSDVDLIAVGRKIATPRLVKELARNYGAFADWLPGASEEQLSRLGFVSASWLRIAAWSTGEAQAKHEAFVRGEHGSSADRQVREAEAEAIAEPARRARDRLHTTLAYLSGSLPAWKSKVDVAYATSVTSVPVADSLSALVAVAKDMLADKSAGMVARRKHMTLDAAALEKHRKAAASLTKAAKAAAAVKTTSPVTQADVDLWDGAAVTFFEQFVEAVEAAREEDPTIPRPTIIGLRGWFRRLSRKKRGRVGAKAPKGDSSPAPDSEEG